MDQLFKDLRNLSATGLNTKEAKDRNKKQKKININVPI